MKQYKKMKKKPKTNKYLPRGLNIIYEDRDLIVIHKPAGLLTMGNERERNKTAYQAMTDYVRKGQSKSRQRVFIVHRLDKDTSGLLVFARNEKTKFYLQDNWSYTTKYYTTVVHGKVKQNKGKVSSYLKENKARKMYSTSNSSQGKFSHTEYEVLKQNERFTLLNIHLITGRKNQIRVHMADIGHPVVGDKKYGRKDDSFKQLALHARELLFQHPFNKKEMHFQSSPPPIFNQLMK